MAPNWSWLTRLMLFGYERTRFLPTSLHNFYSKFQKFKHVVLLQESFKRLCVILKSQVHGFQLKPVEPKKARLIKALSRSLHTCRDLWLLKPYISVEQITPTKITKNWKTVLEKNTYTCLKHGWSPFPNITYWLHCLKNYPPVSNVLQNQSTSLNII
jgi:hypothetical protein